MEKWTPSTTAQPEAIQSLNLEPPPGVNADPEAQRLEISSSSGSLSDSDLLAACEELECSNSTAEHAKPSSTSPTKAWWPSAGVDGTERFPPRSIPITDEPSLPHMPETKDRQKLFVIDGPNFVGKTTFSKLLFQNTDKRTHGGLDETPPKAMRGSEGTTTDLCCDRYDTPHKAPLDSAHQGFQRRLRCCIK